MILYLTGLNAVNPEQIEAGRLDGARGFRMLWHIVLPQLRPATFIAFVVTIIGALRSFDLISVMTNGGPFGESRVLAFYMFEVALSEYGFRMGYGAAIAVVLFAIMLVYIAFFLAKMYRDERRTVTGTCASAWRGSARGCPAPRPRTPWGGGHDAWKVGGRMFACLGAASDGVSVKCADAETAQMLIEAGVAERAPYFHRSWVRLPRDRGRGRAGPSARRLLRPHPRQAAQEGPGLRSGRRADVPPPRHRRRRASGYQALLPVALVAWLLPLIAVATFSIRPDADFATGNYWGWPSGFAAFQNYALVFTGSEMPRYLLNSVLITVPTVLGAVALSTMTGFALGVYRFKGNLLIFFMFVAGNFVPFQILMVPVRELTLSLGLYDTITGLVLFHVAFQTGFCTLFMRNFIRALPFELIEAARVEGVSEWRIFWFVVLPLMKPAMAALAVLIFTFIWNDYFWAVVLTQGSDSQPVTAGITSFNAQYRAAYHLMSAGSLVAALPPVAMFFLMQRHFIAGLTLGAVK